MTPVMKWTGILATMVIVIIVPFYARSEPVQQEKLKDEYYTNAVLASTDLYASNCAVCHGAAGEGIGDTPSLNTDSVRMMSDSDLVKVISRGRSDTLMAAWSSEEGGIFSNSQINDLVTFIQQANWDFVEARVEDLGLTPPQVIEMDISNEMLAAVAELPGGDAMSSGLIVYAEKCAACHGANGAGTLIAPAIDSADLRAKPKEDIIDLVTNGVPGTLMASWGNLLAPSEISSVVDLIFGWPQLLQADIEFPESQVMRIPSSPELITEGEKLFNIACKSCHGTDGYGSPMAPAVANQIFLSETPDAAIYQIIAGGVPGTLMPAWGSRLLDQEIQSLVAFVRSKEASAPAILPPILNN